MSEQYIDHWEVDDKLYELRDSVARDQAGQNAGAIANLENEVAGIPVPPDAYNKEESDRRYASKADLLAKVGYAEVSDGMLNMYADATKARLIATVVLPSGGGTGGGLTENQVRAIIESYRYITTYTDTTYTFRVSGSYLYIKPSNAAEYYIALPSGGGTGGLTEAQVRTIVTSYGYTTNTGTYSKPSTGIPESDLSQGVRDKLNSTEDQIRQGVENYFRENPVEGVTPEMVGAAVEAYLSGKVDKDTTYTFRVVGNYLYIKPSDAAEYSVQLPKQENPLTQDMVDSMGALLEQFLVTDNDSEATNAFEAWKAKWGYQSTVNPDQPVDPTPDEPDPPDTPDEPTLTGIEVIWAATSADVGTVTRTLVTSVKANYSDGSSKYVTNYSVTPATLSEGEQTAVVFYMGQTVTVKVTGIAVRTPEDEGYEKVELTLESGKRIKSGSITSDASAYAISQEIDPGNYDYYAYFTENIGSGTSITSHGRNEGSTKYTAITSITLNQSEKDTLYPLVVNTEYPVILFSTYGAYVQSEINNKVFIYRKARYNA